ncbi:hypothetical protein D3C80_2238230 [compost metagenome]
MENSEIATRQLKAERFIIVIPEKGIENPCRGDMLSPQIISPSQKGVLFLLGNNQGALFSNAFPLAT